MKIQIETLSKKVDHKSLSKNYKKILKKLKRKMKLHKPNLLKLSKGHNILIHFVSDDQIQELNNAYRSKNKPTDVLSWGFISENLQKNEAAGEIYISINTANKQAKDKKHTLNDEIIFLTAHGLLHIFEYDHQTDEEEKEMDQLTKAILP